MPRQIAEAAIKKVMAGEGIHYYSHISQIHPERTILPALMDFQTGWDQFGLAVYGCKVVFSEQNRLITAFPV